MSIYDQIANPQTAMPQTAYLQGRAMRMAYEGEKQAQQFQQMQMEDFQKQRDFQRANEAAQTLQKQQEFQVEQQTKRAEAAVSVMVGIRDAADPTAAMAAVRMAQGAPPPTDPEEARKLADPKEVLLQTNAALAQLAVTAGVKVPPPKDKGITDYQDRMLANTERGLRIQEDRLALAESRPPSTAETTNTYGKLTTGDRWIDPAHPELGAEPIPGAGQGGKQTNEQRKMVSYVRISNNAEAHIDEVAKRFKPSATDWVIYDKVLDEKATSVVRNNANKALSEDAQLYLQGMLEWLDPLQRSRTGAAISATERPQYFRTHFPMAGDSKQVIENKRKSREVATQAMRDQAGTAMSNPGAESGGGSSSKYSEGQTGTIKGQKVVFTGGKWVPR